MTTLIDTNIVIALLDSDDAFHDWAVAKLETRKAEGPVVISDIIYCEVSVAMNEQAEMDEAITRLGLDRLSCSDTALFRAGVAFKKYKDENKGPKLGVLPDFLIGSVAEEAGLPLLTTNPKDFTGYFPTLKIIRPEED